MVPHPGATPSADPNRQTLTSVRNRYQRHTRIVIVWPVVDSTGYPDRDYPMPPLGWGS